MHLAPLIQDLAVILCLAAVMTYLFRRLGQPVVLGYVVAGWLVGIHSPTRDRSKIQRLIDERLG